MEDIWGSLEEISRGILEKILEKTLDGPLEGPLRGSLEIYINIIYKYYIYTSKRVTIKGSLLVEIEVVTLRGNPEVIVKGTRGASMVNSGAPQRGVPMLIIKF